MKKTFILTFLLIFTIIANISTTKAEYQYYHNQAASDGYIYYFEIDLKDGSSTEAEVYDAIANRNYLTPQGLDCFLMHGNLSSYIDDLIAVGRLPQNYTLGSLGGGEHWSYNYDPIGIRGDSPTVTTPTPPSEQTPTAVEVPITPVETTPTLDENKAGIYVVVDDDVKSYETYKKSTVVDTWKIGSQADVKGLMSTGYYKVVKDGKEQYIDKGHLVPLDKYEAAWKETERAESTCGKEGSITYLNTISSEIKTEILAPLEHDYQMINQIAPTCTEKGSQTFECANCADRTTEETLATGYTGFSCQSCGQIIVFGSAMSPVVATTCGLASIGVLYVIGVLLFKKFR